jgi:hypothetical protein
MGKQNPEKPKTKIVRKAKKPATGRKVKKSVPQDKTEENVHKYEATREPSHVPAFEELGKLPESYGDGILYLIARDPHSLFSYWDIKWSKYPKSKMLGDERKIFLRVCALDDAEELRVEIDPEAKNWHLPAAKSSFVYYAELGYLDKKGAWKPIVRSNPAATPPTTLSEDMRADFATIPFHLTFQRLMEMVGGVKRSGETLAGTLSRLQTEAGNLAAKLGSIENLTEEQKALLASLFGGELIDQIGMSSGEINRLLRKWQQESLSSESASGIQAKGPVAPGGASLSSAFGAWGPEVSSLFSALGAWGSEMNQLLGALGAWSSQMSGLSSSAGFWGPESSSLFSGAGFWGPGVTSLSSGIGASWSAQPFSRKKERGFFMHLNAEVIFYGGTHPDAKVRIDGKQIKLSPDGTFRYHFRFPDGDYSIPIVAQSPDKAEKRSATLSFRRTTSRKGDVGHTAQPKHLKKPLGKRK